MSETVHIPVDEAGPTVNDVMMRGAESVGPATPLAHAREVFISPRKRLLLVTDGERFLGTLDAGRRARGGRGADRAARARRHAAGLARRTRWRRRSNWWSRRG